MNEGKESPMYLFSPLFFPLLCLLQPKAQKLAASPLRFCCLPDYIFPRRQISFISLDFRLSQNFSSCIRILGN